MVQVQQEEKSSSSKILHPYSSVQRTLKQPIISNDTQGRKNLPKVQFNANDVNSEFLKYVLADIIRAGDVLEKIYVRDGTTVHCTNTVEIADILRDSKNYPLSITVGGQ